MFSRLVKKEIEYLSYALGYTNDAQAVTSYQAKANKYITNVRNEYETLLRDLTIMESDLKTDSKNIELEINKVVNKNR